jgi:hypothetical protein
MLDMTVFLLIHDHYECKYGKNHVLLKIGFFLFLFDEMGFRIKIRGVCGCGSLPLGCISKEKIIIKNLQT